MQSFLYLQRLFALSYRETKSIWRAFLQLIALYILYEVYNMFEKGCAIYTLRQLKQWEACFESFPEVVLQVYYFIE